MQSLTLRKPDDWHLHVRDGDILASVVPHSARQFGRAIIMPNLKPPVTTTQQALAYRERILAAVPADTLFEPLMTLYLTEATLADELHRAKSCGLVHAVKLYPAGATTHSDAGITRVENIYPALEVMQELDLPLLVHAEVTDPEVDIFDREAVFIERHLQPIRARFPDLRLVLEHATTRAGIEFVQHTGGRVAATITAHHLLYNRNGMLAGGIRPHLYCLPVLKRERDRLALLQVATSGDPRFFLGTDSAPHPVDAKESACGCAGCYSAHAAIELYAEAFETAGALDKLQAFASEHGPDFYGLPRNDEFVTLIREPWEVPGRFALGGSAVIPLRANETIGWRLQ